MKVIYCPLYRKHKGYTFCKSTSFVHKFSRDELLCHFRCSLFLDSPWQCSSSTQLCLRCWRCCLLYLMILAIFQNCLAILRLYIICLTFVCCRFAGQLCETSPCWLRTCGLFSSASLPTMRRYDPLRLYNSEVTINSCQPKLLRKLVGARSSINCTHRVLFTHDQVDWMYFVAFGCTAGGLLIYSYR